MMAPAAGVFFLYHLGDGADFVANFTGFTAGFAFGVVLTMNIADSKVPARRALATSAAAVVISAVAAFPLRGLTDARPEIERVVAFENRTASAYDTASDRFRKGRVAVEVLTQLINKTIVPELEAARTRLKTLERVPPEHEPLVAGAEEYLRLRDESWRLRAEGLDKANMRTLRRRGSHTPTRRQERLAPQAMTCPQLSRTTPRPSMRSSVAAARASARTRSPTGLGSLQPLRRGW